MKTVIFLIFTLISFNCHGQAVSLLTPSELQSGIYQPHYNYFTSGIEYPDYWKNLGVGTYDNATQDINFVHAGTRVDVRISFDGSFTAIFQDSTGKKVKLFALFKQKNAFVVEIQSLTGERLGDGFIKFDPLYEGDSQRISFSLVFDSPHKLEGTGFLEGDLYSIVPEQSGICVWEDQVYAQCNPRGVKTQIISSVGFE